MAKLCAVPRGAPSAAESCVLSADSSHCTQMPFLPQVIDKLAEDIVKPRSPLSSAMVMLAVVETASWCVRAKGAMTCYRAQGRHCRASGSPVVHVKKETPFIPCHADKRHTPKTRSLSEAHLLAVCGGEMEKEMLIAVGKWCTQCSSPPMLLLPSVSKANTSSTGHSPL